MLASAFILGLISSLHCIGMCGPLQALFTGAFLKKKQYRYLIIFHGSRILTYGLLGIAAFTFGSGIRIQLWQQNSSLIGGLLLLMAFIVFYLFKADQKLFRLILPYIHRLKTRLENNRKSKFLYFMGSGMLNGILPCAMVYLAIIPAMATTDAFNGFMFMIIFGSGTIPLLLLANLGVGSFMQQRYKLIKKLSPVLIMLVAFLLILRGMDLGIPYLSPESEVLNAASGVEGCE